MPNCQGAVFAWIAAQPGLTGMVVFAIGLLFAFQGFRLFRFLLVPSCATVGWVVGWWIADVIDFPMAVAAPTLAAAFAAASLMWYRPAVSVACAGTWTALGYYLGVQLGLEPKAAWVCAGVAGGLAILFVWLCFRSMIVILTTLQGAALLVVGFVGFTHAVMPSVESTFRDWAANSRFLVPGLLTMLVATAWSYQAMEQRGDIRSGA